MLRKFLCYINSLPVAIAVKNSFNFGQPGQILENQELNSAAAWDVLRTQHEHFSVVDNRETWLLAAEGLQKKDGQDGDFVMRARQIAGLLTKYDVRSLFSAGVGGAGLEYQLKKNRPEIKLVCSEYSLVNLELLKKVFWECDSIIYFDLLQADWNVTKNVVDPKHHLCLLYRIDPSFTTRELQEIFKNMGAAGIENVLFIPGGRLTLAGLLKLFCKRIKGYWQNINFVFAGYLRTEKMFRSCWLGYEIVAIDDLMGLKGYWLKRKSN